MARSLRYTSYPLETCHLSFQEKCGVVKEREEFEVFLQKKERCMKSSTKNQTKGVFHETKGKIKETVGKIIDNPSLEAEGLAEKIAGKAQQKVGQVEKVLDE